MRGLVSVTFLLVGFCALDPAVTRTSAQNYAPGFAICLHVYGLVSYIDCSYTTLPQCNAAASGRAAQCLVNPYRNQSAGTGIVERSARYRRYRYEYDDRH